MMETSAKKRKAEREEEQRVLKKGRIEATYSHDSYTVGWVCALPKEQTAAVAMLAEKHPSLQNYAGDPNAYTLGSIGGHNIAIACLPNGQIGTVSAAIVAKKIEEQFECPLKCEIKASEKTTPGIETEIIDGVTQAVRGMFLLARLHLGSLRNTTSAREILSALDKFKQQSANKSSDHQVYDEAYNDAYVRIDGQESKLRDLGKNVLSWIVHAVRPLTITELNHALAVDTNRSDTDLDRHNLRDTDTIVSVCAGLVHYTTQEYLKRSKEKYFPTAHFEMTKVCTRYLKFAIESDLMHSYLRQISSSKASNNVDEPYPFFRHATYAWAYHASKCFPLGRDVKELLLDETKMQALSEISVSNEFPNSGLGWAASYGLQEAIEIFYDLGRNLNAPDSFGRTPLFYAARHGRLEAIKQLCELGACPGKPPPNGDEKALPLVVAEFHNHPDAVRLLLERGALIDAQGEHRRTSLALAAYSGNLSLMELLLNHGACIDAVDDQDCTPLIIAAESGHRSCVRLLLEKGARVDTIDEDGCTALAFNKVRLQAANCEGKSQKGRKIRHPSVTSTW